VVVVAAAMAFSYFGSVITRSSTPILRLQHSCNLAAVMENIVADFNRLNAIDLRCTWVASNQYILGSVAIPKNTPNGHYYLCTVAGTSSATEPAWPIASGGTVTDGTVTWKESGNIVWQASHTYASGSYVVPTNNIGTASNPNPTLANHYYSCTGGTSGANEPAWPVTAGSTVTDGTVTWTEAGTILSTTVTNDNLTYYFTHNSGARYGTGYNVTTKFIQFNGNNEVTAGTSGTSSEKNIMKVTITSSNQGESAETLTTYFTIY
jgi:hypothetical protein